MLEKIETQRRIFFERYVFFCPTTHTCRPCSSGYTSPAMRILLAQAVLIHILLL